MFTDRRMVCPVLMFMVCAQVRWGVQVFGIPMAIRWIVVAKAGLKGMQISVVGKHIDIGNALKGHIETNLSETIGKYVSRPAQAHIVLSREGSEFRCDCVVHLDSGIMLRSTGSSGDIYASYEEAAERIAKRVRRYKRRLKNHHNPKNEAKNLAALDYVIAAKDDAREETDDAQPVIVAETVTQIRQLSVGDAVMQLDLADAPVIVFRREVGGELNVVYRRPDGNIGWIDPQPVNKSVA